MQKHTRVLKSPFKILGIYLLIIIIFTLLYHIFGHSFSHDGLQ